MDRKIKLGEIILQILNLLYISNEALSIDVISISFYLSNFLKFYFFAAPKKTSKVLPLSFS